MHQTLAEGVKESFPDMDAATEKDLLNRNHHEISKLKKALDELDGRLMQNGRDEADVMEKAFFYKDVIVRICLY